MTFWIGNGAVLKSSSQWQLRTFGINVHAHPYCACVFLTDGKVSALLRIFRTNCNSNSGQTVHFYKQNFLQMVLVRLHQPWYSTVEIKRGSFHQNERLFVVEKANFLRNVSHPRGKLIQRLTFMII